MTYFSIIERSLLKIYVKIMDLSISFHNAIKFCFTIFLSAHFPPHFNISVVGIHSQLRVTYDYF